MTFAQGSAAWLMRHELRLYWRSGRQFSSVALAATLVALLHLVALGIALVARSGKSVALPQALLYFAITAGLAFALIVMTSRALTAAIQALYTRGDMDLLLSSPIRPDAIVAVRAAAIALGVTLDLALLLWPFANVFVLFGRVAWFKAYLLLPALGMLSTALALLLMIALFRVFGPRRTRVVAQVAAAVLGMSLVVLGQLPNAMRGGASGSRENLFRGLQSHLDGPLWFPAAEVLDGFAPTVLLLLAGAAALVLTVKATGHRFIDASTRVAGAARGGRARAPAAGLRFHGELHGLLIRKELRLIARDPWLLTQLLGQFVFLVPAALLLWRRGATSGVPWAWLVDVFVCGSMVSALAWLTVSAEDAPELLASSPVSTATLVRAKIEAALLSVVPLLLLPPFFLLRSHPLFAVSLSVCSAGAGISCAWLQIRNPVARKRGDFRTRHKGQGLSGLIEATVILVWVGLCAGVTALG